MSSSPTVPSATTGGDRTLNFLGVSGSLRAKSLNTAVVRTAAELCEAPVSLAVYSGIGELPYFSADVDIDDPAPEVVAWRAAIAAADAVLLSCPEYAHGMSGVMKNALEWIVGSGELVDKPVAVVTASPSMTGGDRAQAWVRETLEVMGARILPESLPIPVASSKISGGRVTDASTLQDLRSVLAGMASAMSAPA